MTKNLVNKLINIKAVPCADSNEKWVDETGAVVSIDRKPIDWNRCMNPIYTIKTIKENE